MRRSLERSAPTLAGSVRGPSARAQFSQRQSSATVMPSGYGPARRVCGAPGGFSSHEPKINAAATASDRSVT